MGHESDTQDRVHTGRSVVDEDEILFARAYVRSNGLGGLANAVGLSRRRAREAELLSQHEL